MGANSLERRGRMNKYTPLALLEALKCAPRRGQATSSHGSDYILGPSACGGLRRVWSAQEGNGCDHVTLPSA